MASIIEVNLNLDKIDKSKIFKGKKGSYLKVNVVLNDELGQYGDNGSCYVSQSKEEREGKSPKSYLGNPKVVWTNGTNVAAAPRDGAEVGGTLGTSAPQQAAIPDDDLPF